MPPRGEGRFDQRAELASFRSLWRGGYFEGDPLDPLSQSSYGPLGYVSVLHATYLRCIKPYVDSSTTVLEIGPGRGAWTRTLLGAKEVWCLDALPAEHNGFWQYVGDAPNVHYVHVTDFSCREVPDDSIDFLFSFGALVHVSFDGIGEYFRNLYPKLRDGAEAFVMVADYEKYRRELADPQHRHVSRALGSGRRSRLALGLWRLLGAGRIPYSVPVDHDLTPRPGRWYDAGTARTCALLEELGYDVVDPDVGVTPRDPIVHFRK